MYRHRHRRQSVSGVQTFQQTISETGTALDVDTTASGLPSGLSVPTLTLQSTLSSSSTPTATSSSVPSTKVSKLSTGAIVGIAGGIFAVLAVVLIGSMIIINKRKMRQRRARRGGGNSKSWARLEENKKQQHHSEGARLGLEDGVPMRSVEKPPTLPEITRDDQGSFLTLRSTHTVDSNETHPSTSSLIPKTSNYNNVHSSSAPPSHVAHTQHASEISVVPPSEDGHIPNPFSSPHSRPLSIATTTHHSTNHSREDHLSDDAETQGMHLSAVTPSQLVSHLSFASSVSQYPPDGEEPQLVLSSSSSRNPGDTLVSYINMEREEGVPPLPPPNRFQNLLSALDGQSSFIADSVKTGQSRLSMDDGLVAADAESIRNSYNTTGSAEMDKFPLPPSSSPNLK